MKILLTADKVIFLKCRPHHAPPQLKQIVPHWTVNKRTYPGPPDPKWPRLSLTSLTSQAPTCWLILSCNPLLLTSGPSYFLFSLCLEGPRGRSEQCLLFLLQAVACMSPQEAFLGRGAVCTSRPLRQTRVYFLRSAHHPFHWLPYLFCLHTRMSAPWDPFLAVHCCIPKTQNGYRPYQMPVIHVCWKKCF